MSISSLAEGTKQFRPTSSDVGNLQINDIGRPFALESNSDPLHRLYFHISNTSEKVYFGFQHIGTGTATYRVKDASGNVVCSRTSVPTSGTGYINSYTEAVAGPKISGFPAAGYTPITFTPSSTGDFYIEFTTSLAAPNAYHFDLFDLTVCDVSNNPIDGRLWAYAWDLNTRSSSGRYNGNLFIYTDDGYISEVEMNGIQPFGFVVSCNNTGPSNLALGNNENRKSVDGNSTRPQYKIFLNNPDINVYPNGAVPTTIENLSVVGTPKYGEAIDFTLEMSIGGTVQVVLDINGSTGYQSGTEDVVIVQQISAGKDTIHWDGKDGFGNYLDGGATVLVLSSFATGVTHLPLYDPETHQNGYIVQRTRPFTGACNLYWDDSNFSGGTVNIDGSLTTGHSFGTNFGNNRTMNTWWNGYELDILNNFQFTIEILNLPIELGMFTAKISEKTVLLDWITFSETNNRQFTIERSNDGVKYYAIGVVDGIGNSNTRKNYQFIDLHPNTNNYYRLKQEDYDGKSTISSPIYIEFALNDNNAFQNVYNSCDLIKVKNISSIKSIVLANSVGAEIYKTDPTHEILEIDIPPPKSSGIYYLIITDASKQIIHKIIVR
ncbi:MAG: hypothetical protein WCK02_04890 [Bacteroidota bacterium]